MNSFRIRGFPSLVILDSDGTLLSSSGITDIDQHQEEAINVWLDRAE